MNAQWLLVSSGQNGKAKRRKQEKHKRIPFPERRKSSSSLVSKMGPRTPSIYYKLIRVLRVQFNRAQPSRPRILRKLEFECTDNWNEYNWLNLIEEGGNPRGRELTKTIPGIEFSHYAIFFSSFNKEDLDEENEKIVVLNGPRMEENKHKSTHFRLDPTIFPSSFLSLFSKQENVIHFVAKSQLEE